MITLISGDGDKRLRKSQQSGQFCGRLDLGISCHKYAPTLGINGLGQFPMQDVLHKLKNLICMAKYLGTTCLIMCETEEPNLERYAVRWDILLTVYSASPEFRDRVSKSAILLMDKQDPSIPAEIANCYDIVLQHGYVALAGYLKSIHLLLAVFYDTSLSLQDRVAHLWTIKVFFALWYEHSRMRKTITKHFITDETRVDTNTCIDGLLTYFILCCSKFPGNYVVPWYLNSDAVEQAWAFLRSEEFKGRKSHLDALRVCVGFGKQNRILDLDVEAKDIPQIQNLLSNSVAHTRGKTIYNNVGDPLYVKGSSYTVKDIREAMSLGQKCGEILFTSSSHFRDSYIARLDSDADESHETSDESDTEDEYDTSTIDGMYEKQRARKEAVLILNGGRMNIPNKGRAKKFFQKEFLNPHFFEAQCTCVLKLVKGQVLTGHFLIQKKLRGPWVNCTATGEILFLSRSLYRSKNKSGGNSTVASEPTLSLCQKCDDMKVRFWIRIDGSIYLGKKFSKKRSGT